MELFHHALAAGTARLSDIGLHDAGVVLTHTPNDIPAHHTHTHARTTTHIFNDARVFCEPFNTVSLQPPPRGGPDTRSTFVAQIAYKGGAFSGFAVQPDPIHTVQGAVQRALTRRLQPRGGRVGEQIRVTVAGRTDRGVHACAQVRHGEVTDGGCGHGLHPQQLLSLYTFGKDSCQDVLDALNEADPGNLAAAWVACVPRTFHPAFQVLSCMGMHAPL